MDFFHTQKKNEARVSDANELLGQKLLPSTSIGIAIATDSSWRLSIPLEGSVGILCDDAAAALAGQVLAHALDRLRLWMDHFHVRTWKFLIEYWFSTCLLHFSFSGFGQILKSMHSDGILIWLEWFSLFWVFLELFGLDLAVMLFRRGVVMKY